MLESSFIIVWIHYYIHIIDLRYASFVTMIALGWRSYCRQLSDSTFLPCDMMLIDLLLTMVFFISQLCVLPQNFHSDMHC